MVGDHMGILGAVVFVFCLNGIVVGGFTRACSLLYLAHDLAAGVS
jgi:hypothetical protein